MTKPLFKLGKIVATPGALDFLERQTITQLLQRHVTGDFGDLCAEDKEANHEAIESAERILSSYKVGDSKVWIITEADRSSTCCLLPEEY